MGVIKKKERGINPHTTLHKKAKIRAANSSQYLAKSDLNKNHRGSGKSIRKRGKTPAETSSYDGLNSQVVVESVSKSKFTLRVGDKIVYPGHGVGVIEDVETKSLGGESVEFYVIRLENSDVKLFIPVEQAHSKAIRRIISPREVADIIASIRKSKKKIKDLESWNRRVREYSEIVKNCEVHELADLISEFKSLNKVKTLSFGEKKILDTAKQLLASELSLAKGTSVEKITEELDSIIGVY
ncbi:MAG: hypothetical protein NZO16_01290 [Deltaproteobacteria bacterium]|nr:hypothetical protein [Deltaproteobacteria bacterium]